VYGKKGKGHVFPASPREKKAEPIRVRKLRLGSAKKEAGKSPRKKKDGESCRGGGRSRIYLYKRQEREKETPQARHGQRRVGEQQIFFWQKEGKGKRALLSRFSIPARVGRKRGSLRQMTTSEERNEEGSSRSEGEKRAWVSCRRKKGKKRERLMAILIREKEKKGTSDSEASSHKIAGKENRGKGPENSLLFWGEEEKKKG